MMKIPGRFERVAAAFDEAARVRSCESSGSEHSTDLSDLVNSFIEREIREQKDEEFVVQQHKDGNYNEFDDDDDDEWKSNSPDFESPDVLKSLFDHDNDAVKRNIHAEVEMAYREVGSCTSSSPDFKRRLMARLRSRGFDAGICKSRWEKKGRCPLGSYEYVDVDSCGARYIVEVFLAGEFTIARPTSGYATLLQIFPQIYIGKAEELKRVVTLMCNSIRRSMKSAGIHVPPWRRLAYMQSKWFGCYKRTTNEISSQKDRNIGGEMWGKQRVGVVPLQGISFYCREDFATGSGVRIGNLSAALKRKEMML